MTVFNGSLAILNISPLRRIWDSRLRKEESQRDGRQFGQTQEKVNWVKRSFKEDVEKGKYGVGCLESEDIVSDYWERSKWRRKLLLLYLPSSRGHQDRAW